MLTLQNKNVSGGEIERTQYMKNYYQKRKKKLVNDLINHAEELENVFFSKQRLELEFF